MCSLGSVSCTFSGTNTAAISAASFVNSGAAV